MTYLKSPYDAAAAIGASSSGNQPHTSDTRFIAMLEGSTAQIERLLGTALSQSGYRDTFMLDGRFVRNVEEFRLTAGFVDPASLLVVDAVGTPLNSEDFTLHAERGVLKLTNARAGSYTVTYTAGFAAGTDDVFVGTPEWLKSLCDQACTLWMRSIGTPRAIEGLSYAQHMSTVYKQLGASIYGRYQRPRPPAHYPYATDFLPVA